MIGDDPLWEENLKAEVHAMTTKAILREAIAQHLWTETPETNPDKIADKLVPVLLEKFKIETMHPLYWPTEKRRTPCR